MGYCYNSWRSDFSYRPVDGPWYCDPSYTNANLDVLWPNASERAILADGNGVNHNGDWGQNPIWNVFTTPWQDDHKWSFRPIHGSSINILFMDGHVASMEVVSAQARLWSIDIGSVACRTRPIHGQISVPFGN